MPLLVMLADKQITYVTKDDFSDLVTDGKILVFKRPGSSDWIDPKIGPLRGNGPFQKYNGPERRARF